MRVLANLSSRCEQRLNDLRSPPPLALAPRPPKGPRILLTTADDFSPLRGEYSSLSQLHRDRSRRGCRQGRGREEGLKSLTLDISIARLVSPRCRTINVSLNDHPFTTTTSTTCYATRGRLIPAFHLKKPRGECARSRRRRQREGGKRLAEDGKGLQIGASARRMAWSIEMASSATIPRGRELHPIFEQGERQVGGEEGAPHASERDR